MPIDGAPARELADTTGRSVSGVEALGENAYCTIWKARCGDETVVFKKYKKGDPRLPELEAKGVDFYHSLAVGDDSLIDSRSIVSSPDRGLVAVGFVPGGSLASFVYSARNHAGRRDECMALMRRLGRLLRQMHTATAHAGAAFDPFHGEYIAYCSDRLASVPLLGAKVLRGPRAGAAELYADLLASGTAPSFAHGDFVFRNIHVHEGRIGLIDFANCLERSHLFNDHNNLRLALANMLLPAKFAAELWVAFEDGLGSLDFPEAARRFFFEFHRRRWLMLNIRTRDPRRWIRAARGMRTFARPWTAGERRP